MKLVYIGDPHERPTKPINRTDNYEETYVNKVNEIKGLVASNNAKALLQPGDFLDAPKYDNKFLMEIVERWSNAPVYQLVADLQAGKIDGDTLVKELSKEVPMIGAVGNHELFGESSNSFPKTSLAFLEQIGFMILPTKDKPFILTDDDGTTVAITTTHYHSKIDTDAFLDDYIIEKKAADFHIHMVHGYLTNRDMGNMFKHTTLDKIAHDTQADLTIAGHDHIGFPLTEVNGKLFINPGSMTRTKSDVKEIGRKPKALVIDITKANGVVVEEHELVSAKTGSDVLSRDSINQRQAKSRKMEEIKSIVNKAQLKQGASITSIIKNIGDADGFEKGITEEVVKKVTERIDEMNPDTQEDVEDYTIKTLTLENFQGHRKTVLDLHEGLNVIVGESSHGKSSIYRALDWLYDNAGNNPRLFIKNGADYAKVTAELSNGYVVSRIVELKGHGKNGYEVYDPATKELEYSNTRGAEAVRQLLGFHKVQLDNGKDLDINFMGQGESWFFIGNHVTPSERAKMIGSIFGTHYTDSVLKEMEGELKKSGVDLKSHEEQLEETLEQINSFSFLDRLEKTLGEADLKMNHVAQLEEKSRRLQALKEKFEKTEEQAQALKGVLTSLKGLDDAKCRLSELRQTQSHIEQLVSHATRLTQIKHATENLESLQKQWGGIESARQILDMTSSKVVALKQSRDELEAHKSVLRRLGTIQDARQDVTKVLDKSEGLKDIQSIYSKLHSVEQKVGRLSVLKDAQGKVSKLSVSINKGKMYLKDNKVLLNGILDKYQEVLLHAGSCPTCHGSIDKAVVNQVVAEYRPN